MWKHLVQGWRSAIIFCALLATLAALGGCNVATGRGGDTTQSRTATGPASSPNVSVDPSNVRQLLALSHEKGPQDVTYVLTEMVTGSQGNAQGSGKAIFTRSPQRFLLDVQFSSAPSLSRTQIYDYGTKKITSTRSGTTGFTPSSSRGLVQRRSRRTRTSGESALSVRPALSASSTARRSPALTQPSTKVRTSRLAA